MAFRVRNPSVPFTFPISGGLSEGKGFKIKGHIQGHAQRFEVNLVCANGDIAFHFNPRFDEGPVVVCNTKQSSRWGTEERASEMPFQRGTPFSVMVIIKSHCYQVFVKGNDKRFLEYRHRLSTHHIHALEIKGDIDLSKVTVKDITGPKPEYFPGEGSFI